MKKYMVTGGMVGFVLGIIIDLWFLSQSSCFGMNADGTSNCPTKGWDIFLMNLEAVPMYPHISIVGIPILLGVIIGFIYGKFKNRNKLVQ